MHATFPPIVFHPVLYPSLLAYPFFKFGKDIREHDSPKFDQDEALEPIKFHLIRSK